MVCGVERPREHSDGSPTIMQRIVMHIDMNSYFASVEQQANPFLRGKPIGVTGKRFDTNRADEAQRSIIATASREAKALGVKTAMSTWEAKRILPSLIIVPGDPEKYSEITHRFNAIYHEFTDCVQQASVDESYLDVTDFAKDYFGATMMAQAIRERLREECGDWITASIGVGPNKLIAKLASESHKPNGLTVVRPDQVMAFLDTRELQDFSGIGWRTARHLADMGILTVQNLRDCPVEVLEREFHSWGTWLHEAAFGRDHFEVIGEDVPPKSVGHSYTLPHDVDDVKEIKRNLLAQCDKVAWRLRRDNFVARSVSAYVRFGDLGGFGAERRFKEATADGLKLFQIAWSLLAKHLDHQSVRLVGISAGQLSHGTEAQSFFPAAQKYLKTTNALDKLQTRFGSHVWTRASTLGIEFKARSSGWHFDHEL